MNERERPSWDVYFLNICDVVSSRSPDPRTQHGAVLVDAHKHIIGTGYNGGPKGGIDTFDWTTDEKYSLVAHAELNCLLNSTMPAAGATLYITGSPCLSCLCSDRQVILCNHEK